MAQVARVSPDQPEDTDSVHKLMDGRSQRP